MSPPKYPLRFFRWFCHPRLRNTIEGDLMELYHERVLEQGKRKADLKFTIDVMLLFRPGIIRPSEGHQHLNHYGMMKSYFTIGWRTLWRNKGYSLINIGCLVLGMAVSLLISLWTYDELSFNKNHVRYERLGRVYRHEMRNEEIHSPIHTTGLGTLLKTEYSSHFKNVVLIRQRLEERTLAFRDRKFNQKGYFTQPQGVSVLSLKMKQGTADALNDMNSIIISESLAAKLFGTADPMDQTLTMDARWELKVTGVYEDLPKNSDFTEGTYMAPLDLYLNGWSHLNVWDNYNMNILVELQDGESFDRVSGIIQDAMLPHIDTEHAKSKPELFILPMKQWHLYTKFENGIPVAGERMKFIGFCGVVGLFVLILACINFMNLSTARSEKRAKEVGVRKSIGSHRRQLIAQFYSESLLVVGIAFVLSLAFVKIVLPYFNSISDKTISIPWTNPVLWGVGFLFVLVTGLLAGSYPALYLSSFSPVKVLKGTFRAGKFASLPRKFLVVIQFTVSVSLMGGTIIVYRQIEFAKDRPAGYSREGLIALHSGSPELKGKYQALRNVLKQTGAVEEMAEANYPLTSTLGWNGGFEWRGKSPDIADPTFNINAVTYEYGKTVGWDFVQGRDFSRELASDAGAVVVNETALKVLGIENPLGEILTETRNGKVYLHPIIGVVRDVIKGSPFDITDPCFYFVTENDMSWIYIRLNPNARTRDALSKIEKAFTQTITSAPFEYTFADDDYNAKFKQEERIGTLATIFSSLAIFISCAGLFGLISFVAEQRTKEIGIRKVLGASVANLWLLLTKDFVMLVLLASCIAIPLAWYFLGEWLNGYAYHVEISAWIFAVSAIATLIITLLTVSIQAIRAALNNPVNSLRSE